MFTSIVNHEVFGKLLNGHQGQDQGKGQPMAPLAPVKFQTCTCSLYHTLTITVLYPCICKCSKELIIFCSVLMVLKMEVIKINK